MTSGAAINHMLKTLLWFTGFGFSLLLVACAPTVIPAGDPIGSVKITQNAFIASDGESLPLQHWGPVDDPDAVILGLHGFGDYANAFDEAGTMLASDNIALFAYDQRGFGRTATRPFWSGIQSLVNDAAEMLVTLRLQYPDRPVYLMGDSMGGAVAIVTAASRPRWMDGVILVAPAVWNRDMMPWYQTAPLSVISHSLPWLPLSGQGLDIWPSDNIEMLRRLSRDPHMMKSVRVDMVAGLADLMDLAHQRAGEIDIPTLLLSGEQDQVIPPAAIGTIAKDIRASNPDRSVVCLFPDGYHMLLRDLNGPTVIGDIRRWIKGGAAARDFSCTLN
jgi:alpha-beta hydrolase superfamily lysophospholipase